MREQLLSIVVQFILGIVGIIAAYVLKKISDALELQKQSIVARKGADNYNHALSVAKGMYYVLEEEFSSVKKAGKKKKDEMEKRLLQVIPGLTQNELDSINKEICNSVKQIGEEILKSEEVEQVSTNDVLKDK
ncbi:hypothetical protein [Clostridium kluyveri]|uniref:Phage-related protein n=1 Tax=Clostridium kluyveri TaxID=1534 RepID=A0A1L5F5Q1_CLOKL|nr:hypothetical protein [Clostridium kluyveri]APM38341.1 hypothetical protein BS101_06090 [Clostridium kluyveri]UZQ50624.1 hypothetical protein OP486_00095 [Clostridium kluyveri]